MFDAEKLLGQMMGDAMSGALGTKRRKQKRKPSGLSGLLGGTSGSTKAKLGMGLVGLAFAAFDHFKQGSNRPSGTAASPPPPPASNPSLATPPPPPSGEPPKANNESALHLIRAMIAAADADGLIDDEERNAILGRAKEAGFDAESLQALSSEISAPFSLKQLVARTPENLRDETYAAALIAISADTEEEKQFMDQLAQALNLDASARQDIHQQLGL